MNEQWEELERLAEQVGHAKATTMRFRTSEPSGAGATAFNPSSTIGVGRDAVPAAPHAEALRLVEEIGKGGMGVVFKAVQTGLEREVAVKRLSAMEPAHIAQFICEARVTGFIEHPNIIPVHLLGASAEGEPQIAMKLVKGTSWRDLIHRPGAEAPTLDEHLRILISVCNAVAFAHEQGFIHRDLKPENVMVGSFGQVFVVDWGIAVTLDEALARRHELPHVADVRFPAGTPCYMAPELATGDGGQQGPRTDVYLLGACLHEVLTRTVRHDGRTMRDVLQAAICSDPHAYASDVPWELAEIANRATAARAEDRYAGADAFRDAIEGYLTHKAAHAVAAKGRTALTALHEVIAAHAALGAAVGMPEDSSGKAAERHAERARLDARLHALYTEAQFAFRHALSVWPGTREAETGLRESCEAMLRHALGVEDVALCERILLDHADVDGAGEVAALRRRLAERAREIETLRRNAARLDWSRIGGPLGDVFVAGGVIGAAVLLASMQIISSGVAHAFWINAGLWTAAAAAIGIFARLRMRGARAPESLVSPRMLGTWGAVGLGCLAVGLLNEWRPVKLSADMGYPALLMGVGFVAMALQTRRWLLVPAALFYAGALLIGYRPTWGYEVLSLTWLLVMVGVGLALRFGVRLEE